MANSLRYREFSVRLTELRRNMLPAKFSPTGEYSERIMDRARGFRVLAHAETESLLEDIAREAIFGAIKSWKTTKKPSVILFCFVTCYHYGWHNGESDSPFLDSTKHVKIKERIEEVIDVASRQYVKSVLDQNNGVKSANLKSIFLPLGIDFDDLDQTWLANMNQFGTARGDIAHQSKKVIKTIDPESEWNEMKGLRAGLKNLDALLGKVLLN